MDMADSIFLSICVEFFHLLACQSGAAETRFFPNLLLFNSYAFSSRTFWYLSPKNVSHMRE